MVQATPIPADAGFLIAFMEIRISGKPSKFKHAATTLK